MERSELIRRIVLGNICTDYENLDQTILHDAARDARRLGFNIERQDVVEALRDLVSNGFAHAYRLSPSEQSLVKLDTMPPLEEVEEYFETYFLVTPAGRDFELADHSWWPFDD